MTIDAWIRDGGAPIVAILRGVAPDEAVAIGEALVANGIGLIEVPFNSPDPAESIRRLVDTLGDRALCGAGTVLDRASVDRTAAAGGRLIVAPNTDSAVIEHAVGIGLEVMPGFATPSEAFAAITAGARRLKLFPATGFGPGYLRAVREILPAGIGLWAVGGTGAANIGEWLHAGAEGIGVGSALYKRGDGPAEVASRASALVKAWRERP